MRAAIVSLHGQHVGQLERLDEVTQEYVFGFERTWLDDPDRPTLGQLFIERMPDEIRTSGLSCWFDHLLPQGPSRRLFQRIAGLDEDEDDSFELLVSMGMDLPGAVVMQPTAPRLLDIEPSRAKPDEVIPSPVGFSLPGAQNKLSIREGERGLVVPARGEHGLWIAKFDDPSFPGLPTLELATTHWAVRSGIRAHETRLVRVEDFERLPDALPLGDGNVFLAVRFDRGPDGRIHAEDFGQVLDIPAGNQQYHARYEDIARVLATLSPEDVKEYVERLAFMVVSGNGDAHLKNWGLVYPDHRTPRLGPAYDLVATVARRPKDDLGLVLDGTRSFAEISLDSFCALARVTDHTEAEVLAWARGARDRSLEAWSSDSRHLPFTEQERERIEEHFRRTPLCSP